MWKDAPLRRGRSPVFKPSGQVGLVCDGSAACLSVFGSTSFVVLSTLRQFTVYDTLALRTSFVSLPLLCNVKHISTKYEKVYVVLCNDSIFAFHRYEQQPIENRHSSEVLGILTAGDAVITFSKNEVQVYEEAVSGSSDSSNEESSTSKASSSHNLGLVPKKTISFPDNLSLENVVPLVGFKNKALLCASNGELHLCNISTGKLIHTFQFSDAVLSQQMKDQYIGISAMVQSQLQSHSIIAVGYSSGDVLIVDVEGDEVLGSLKLSTRQHYATSLAFVYDAMGIMQRGEKSSVASEALLIGTANGDIVIFDLSEFRTFSVIEGAHVGPVKQLMYIERENNIITAGTDNSLVLWAMDSDKQLLRECKSRRGLIGEINFMTTYDPDEMDLLVCSSSDGIGYLSKASTIQQLRCSTFSSSASKNKIRKVVALASCYQRHYDWPNIATCHQGSHVVHLWSGHRRALVDGVLKVPGMTAPATAVCISRCGNYVVVGYESGQMHLFMLQSTNHEEEFVIKTQGERSPAHSSRVISLFILGGIQLVSVSDSSKDRAIRTWDISTASLKDTYIPELPKDVGVYLAVGGNLLTALACTDGTIYLVDVLGKMVIRTIQYGMVTSMSFHPNGSWFIANASDSTMIVYDILSACYVEYAKFTGNVLAVNIDSGGTFLNLTIQNIPGIIMRYANKHVFEINAKTILYKDLNQEPVMLQLPYTVKNGQMESIVDEQEPGAGDEGTTCHEYISSVDPLARGMISLSGMSSGKLQSILFLDEIKERSKPIEPPKAPESIPFFLPTTYKDGQLVFVEPEASGQIQEEKPKHKEAIVKPGDILGEFEALLTSKEKQETKYDRIMAYLLSQTPSGVHLALSTLPIDKKNQCMLTMLNFFAYQQKRKENYDALQVFLHIFLKYHGEAITKLKGSAAVLEKLGAALKEDKDQLQTHFDRISCFIKFFAHLQME